MFRNNKRKKQQLRCTRDDSEDSEDNTDTTVETEEREKLKKIRKRRKHLDSVQYKRGVSVAALMAGPSAKHAEESEEKKPESGISSQQQFEGIMERKHRQAMEAFIQSKMKPSEEGGKKDPNTTSSGSTAEIKCLNKTATTTEELYAQLHQKALQMAGKEPEAEAKAKEHEDVGAGGALVAGTGLVEVVLPVEERLKTMKDTALALEGKKKQQETYHQKDGLTRTSAALGGGGVVVASNATSATDGGVPGRFTMSSAPPVPHPEDINTSAGKNTMSQATIDTQDATQDTSQDGRVGFAAYRQTGSNSGSHEKRDMKNKQTDDHRYRQFVSRQKEQRRNR